VPEHGAGVHMLDVLVEPKAAGSFGKDRGERGLADLERVTAEIVAVESRAFASKGMGTIPDTPNLPGDGCQAVHGRERLAPAVRLAETVLHCPALLASVPCSKSAGLIIPPSTTTFPVAAIVRTGRAIARTVSGRRRSVAWTVTRTRRSIARVGPEIEIDPLSRCRASDADAFGSFEPMLSTVEKTISRHKERAKCRDDCEDNGLAEARCRANVGCGDDRQKPHHDLRPEGRRHLRCRV
jgi:hypothetical protein